MTDQRLTTPDSDDNSTERTLYFHIRYDWETRATQFSRLDDKQSSITDLGPNETVQRCEILIHRPIPTHTVPAEQFHLESDRIDWDKISVSEVMRRLHPLALFPVLPIEVFKNQSLVPVMIKHDSSEDNKRKSQTLSFCNRKFRITVEELDE